MLQVENAVRRRPVQGEEEWAGRRGGGGSRGGSVTRGGTQVRKIVRQGNVGHSRVD